MYYRPPCCVLRQKADSVRIDGIAEIRLGHFALLHGYKTAVDMQSPDFPQARIYDVPSANGFISVCYYSIKTAAMKAS